MKKIQDLKFKRTIQYAQYLPDVVLVVALGLGLYTQWTYTEDRSISVIALLGMFVFAVSCALQYYFSMQNLGRALFHLWVGCLLGILTFTNSRDIEYVTTQEVMEALFMTSLILTWFWNILERMLRLFKQEAALLSAAEGLESLGLIAACLVTGIDAIALSMLIIAYVCHLIALRMKSFVGLFSFIGLLLVGSFVFFPDLDLKPNVYALVCFFGRHAFQPLLDFYFSPLTVLECWRSFFNQSRFIRHLLVILIFLLDLTFAAVIGERSRTHKEWFVVVPIFAAFAVLWLLFHLLYFLSCWKLMSKISDCNTSYQSVTDESQTYNRILEARGIRHYSLLSQRLIFSSLLTTVILMGIGWTTRTSYSLSLTFIVLPIECMTVSLFWSLGSSLGGTCTGYAIIAPVSSARPNGTVKLLPPVSVQDAASKATTLLGAVQQFFNFHMIDNYGCDYSTSGLSSDHLETKVNAFFDHRTSDGPRYDTYIVFYSGTVHENGDWALPGDKSLSLNTLLEWWAAKNVDSGARLILVLDTTHSCLWTKEVRSVRKHFVAVQTCQYFKPVDPESTETNPIGKFTQDWISYNLGMELDMEWRDRQRCVRPIYSVSRHWTDFTFHLPTAEDFTQHWDSNFPKVTKPLIKAVNLPSIGVLCCCCECVTRCLKRKQMKWLPPKEIDTGHGFKLVKS